MKWFKRSVIGKGSFGTVSVASPIDDFNSSDSAVVAVKSADVDSSSTLIREGKFLHELRGCPEIVRCFGEDISMENDNKIYNLFLEYAPGGTLEDLVIKNGARGLSEFNVSCYAYMILRGLRHIHRRGYVHCDLKPANILVFPSTIHFPSTIRVSFVHLKIADFGLAKKAGSPTGPSLIDGELYHLRGTPVYNSPESVLLGQHEAPMDIWAFGVTLFELLTGKSGYWNFENLEDLLEQIANCGNELQPGVPEYVSEKAKEFLLRCLTRDPRERWTADMLLKHPFIVDNFMTRGNILKAKKVSMNPLGGATDPDRWFSGRSLFSTSPPPKPKQFCYLPHQIFAGALHV